MSITRWRGSGNIGGILVILAGGGSGIFCQLQFAHFPSSFSGSTIFVIIEVIETIETIGSGAIRHWDN